MSWVRRFSANGLNIPDRCKGCGEPLLLENLFVDDGCPCNTPRGVNFKPQPCRTCKENDCVKPGHRLCDLFGKELARYLVLDNEAPPEGATVWDRLRRPPV